MRRSPSLICPDSLLLQTGKQGITDEKALKVCYEDDVEEPTFRKGSEPKTTDLVIQRNNRRQTMAPASLGQYISKI